MADGTYKKAGDFLKEYLLEMDNGASATVRTYGGNCFSYKTKDGSFRVVFNSVLFVIAFCTIQWLSRLRCSHWRRLSRLFLSSASLLDPIHRTPPRRMTSPLPPPSASSFHAVTCRPPTMPIYTSPCPPPGEGIEVMGTRKDAGQQLAEHLPLR